MSQYSDTQKAEAVELYLTDGTAKAAKQFGVTTRTINNWVKDAGVTSQERIEKTEGAREVLAATQAEKREELRVLLLDAPIRLVQQAIDTDRARDAQSWMIAAGIGVDKFRLEMGEATGRTETVDLAAAEATIDQEVARLAKLHDAKHS